MEINELIERLQEMAENDPNAKVFLGSQPHYPMVYGVCGVVQRAEFEESEPGEDGDSTDVFLLEGDQIGYGSKKMWEVMS